MKRFAILVALLLASPALAQQPEIQALQSKLMQELNLNLQCTTEVIRLQARVKELEAMVPKPKDGSPPKPE